MNMFDFVKVKTEKANVTLRYRRLRTLANLFRFIEFLLFLVFLSYLTTFLPFAVKIIGEYCWRLSTIIVKPVFVFVVSNFIIVVLVFKSGKFPASYDDDSVTRDELYVEFVKKCDEQTDSRSENDNDESLTELDKDDIVYQDKQIISEITNTSSKHRENGDESDELVMIISKSETEMKLFRRTKSEMLNREVFEKPVHVLRRSETEKCGKVTFTDDEKQSDDDLFGVDELTVEEFNRTIEAFIEKQVTFHRRERFSVVPYLNRI